MQSKLQMGYYNYLKTHSGILKSLDVTATMSEVSNLHAIKAKEYRSTNTFSSFLERAYD